jgi:transposase InsO family protein
MGDTLAAKVRISEDDAMPWPTLTMNESRREFVRRAQMRDANVAALCREFTISRKTAYKWLTRAREDGLSALREASRRPHHCASQLNEDVVCALGKLKLAHPRWGPVKIHELYRRLYGEAPSVSSCHRVLQKLGLVQKRRRRVRRSGSGFTGVPVAQRPNQVWTVDFKGWWTLASGERCEPLTVCDAYSRMVLATIIPTSTGFAAIKQVFVQLFEQYGLPEILHTDNGSPFACTCAPLGLTRLSAWWISLGIDLARNRPAHPQDNPSHERMHGDLESEISNCVQADRRAQQAALDLWRHEYNQVRPHQSLNQRCPAEVYRRSERKYCNREPDYGPGFIPRKVNKVGVIGWRSQRVFISSALAGHVVGLRRTVDNQLEVWLHHVLIGQIDLQTYAFRVAPSRAPERVRLSA